MPEEIQPEYEKPKRLPAKKIKGDKLGPFKTICTVFDKGDRAVEVSISVRGIYYRLKGRKEEYFLPHAVGYMKSLSLETEFDTSPRTGRIKRSSIV